MAYPELAAQDVADYSGRPVESYPPYTEEALRQSRLLFKVATCLSDWPADEDDAELARYAILSMTDALVLSQPHAKVMANPFSSESIGSYSYSKAQKQVQQGLPTGVTWFDLAVERLGVCASEGVVSGAISVFDNDPNFGMVGDRPTYVGPAELNNTDVPYLISSDRDPPTQRI